MSILIAFLTLVLVLNCLLLVLLVLIQLPKKEAGAGLAFGGGATDALFGSGSGNALTKLTKYAAAFFLGLSVLLGILNINRAHSSTTELRKALANQKNSTTPVAAPAPVKPANQFTPIASNSVPVLTINTNAVSTNTANAARALTNTAAPK